MDDKLEVFMSGIAGGIVAAGYLAWGGVTRFLFDIIVAGLAAYYLAPLVVQFTPATVEITTSIGFVVGLVSGVVFDRLMEKLTMYDFGFLDRLSGGEKKEAPCKTKSTEGETFVDILEARVIKHEHHGRGTEEDDKK